MQTLQQLAAAVDPGTKTISVRHLAAVLGIMPPVSLRTLLDPVLREITKFERSTLPGVWPHIAKDELIADIKLTIANPLKVNQQSTPLCGPTAIVFELVSRKPERYVQLCRQLWETGTIIAHGTAIQPSETLRESADPPLSPADWMLIAGLRDDANLIFAIESDVSGLAGFTGPPLWITEILGPTAMETWTFKILGYNLIDSLSTFITEEMKAMGMANNAWLKGGVAFLLIDANLLREKDAGLFPDHWVAYQGGLQVNAQAGTIQFNCYSWGKIHPVSMKLDKFTEYMFGVVTGIP